MGHCRDVFSVPATHADFFLALSQQEDLSVPTIRNYLSDLRLFIAWWETTTNIGREDVLYFHPPTRSSDSGADPISS
ncbi:MAG: site-specific integrase [Bacilli bacterium]